MRKKIAASIGTIVFALFMVRLFGKSKKENFTALNGR